MEIDDTTPETLTNPDPTPTRIDSDFLQDVMRVTRFCYPFVLRYRERREREPNVWKALADYIAAQADVENSSPSMDPVEKIKTALRVTKENIDNGGLRGMESLHNTPPPYCAWVFRWMEIWIHIPDRYVELQAYCTDSASHPLEVEAGRLAARFRALKQYADYLGTVFEPWMGKIIEPASTHRGPPEIGSAAFSFNFPIGDDSDPVENSESIEPEPKLPSDILTYIAENTGIVMDSLAFAILECQRSISVLNSVSVMFNEVMAWSRDFWTWKEAVQKEKPQRSVAIACPPHPIQLPFHSGNDDIVSAPSGKHYAALQRAMAAATDLADWPLDEEGLYRCFRDGLTGWDVMYRAQISARDHSENLMIHGEQVMDLMDIVYWHWDSNEMPEDVGINDRMLSDYRKIAKLNAERLKLQQQAMKQILSIVMSHPRLPQSRFSPMIWDACPSGCEIEGVPLLMYYIQPGPLIKRMVRHHAAYSPRFGGFYEPCLWALHPQQDRLVKQLARYLRIEWRDHLEEYMADDISTYRTWRYHLRGAGINYEKYRARPTEFLNSLNKALLRQVALAPYQEAEGEALEQHPHKDKPDLDCQECGGTGRVLSTANPQAKWDWYQIGGRFTGLFDSEYKPAQDPANWETCHVCGGLGVRTDYAYWFKGDNLVASHQLDSLNRPGDAMEPSSSGAPNEAEATAVQAFIVGSEEPRSSTETAPAIPEGAERRPWCNGCHGEGKRLKWPTQWQQYEGDIMPVCALPHNIVPFSIVTPDGEWYEQGEMGWWGMVGNKQNTEVWERKCRALFDEYAHCIAVVCDLHI